MKTLVTVLVLAMTVTAAAQINTMPIAPGQELPKTVIIKAPDGSTIGTATTSGNRVVIRNAEGQLTGTVVFGKDHSQTYIDPNGKIVKTISVDGKTVTVRGGDDQIISTTTLERDGTAILRDAAGQIIGTSKK